MDISEKRIIGALLLLAGVTFLSVGFYTGELDRVIELMKSIFAPALAGLP